jgi:predicted unusual protein kinase regulating ubiquinone biosynthesis (AarF/ABC1/UbiB family)
MPSRPLPFPGRSVPQGRLSRLASIGGTAAGVTGAMLVDGAARLARGERFRFGDLLLTPANAARLTEGLARLRGAAMKIGQMVSMDGGGVLPAELAEILARLRAEAAPMPERQLRAVLDANWGAGWEARFAEFGFAPVAAASIGQVHRAVTRDGRVLAVKVQYPGVRESIDSDVDNVAALLRLSGLVPPAVDPAPLLAEAKRQLHEEADYRHEARCLEAFGRLLADDPDFLVPAPAPDLSSGDVLAMSFAQSVPIERLEAAPRAERDRVAAKFVELALRELFAFGLVQTDPNFANYRYQPDTGRIVLLDFGAARPFAPALAEKFRRLMRAGLDGSREASRRAMLDLGILEESHPRLFQAAVLVAFDTLFEAIRAAENFDFADAALGQALQAQALELSKRRDALRPPPPDVLFLQRKAGGLFLLAARLKARAPVRRLMESYAA